MTDHLRKQPTDEGLDEYTDFDVPEGDPRRTENRGGLEATLGQPESKAHPDSTPGADNLGTTGADASDVNDDTGAAGTGQGHNGQVDFSTTGMVAPKSGPPGAGPTEGSQSGAIAPHVEITDAGPVDLNAADNAEPGESGSEGAEVRDEAGNLL